MSVNRIVVHALPASVGEVLADGHRYADWVVGTKRIRVVDPAWPAAGARFHHSLGVGPLLLHDSTLMVEEGAGRMEMRARMMPVGVNRVVLTWRAHDDGCEVMIEERPVEGPAGRIWCPPLDAVMGRRNAETLRRLKRVAEEHHRAVATADPQTSATTAAGR